MAKVKDGVEDQRNAAATSTIPHLQFMRKLLIVLCLVNPYVFTNQIPSRKYITFVGIGLLIFTALHLFVTFKSVRVQFTVDNILYILVTTSMLLTNVEWIIFINLLNSTRMRDFLTDLHVLAEALEVKCGYFLPSNRIIYKCEIILLHTLYLGYVTFDIWVHATYNGLHPLQGEFIGYVEMYLIMLTTLQMYACVMAIKHCFEALNRMLIRHFEARTHAVATDLHGKVNEVSEKYARMCRLITAFNKIYGVHIFLQLTVIVLTILQSFCTLLEVALAGEDPNEGKVGYGFSVVLYTTWRTMFYLLFAVFITASCHQATEMALNTNDTCYKLMLRMPATHNTDKVRQSLLLLTQQIRVYQPRFYTLGSVQIDYGLLASLFGSITSYIIVMLQFPLTKPYDAK